MMRCFTYASRILPIWDELWHGVGRICLDNDETLHLRFENTANLGQEGANTSVPLRCCCISVTPIPHPAVASTSSETLTSPSTAQPYAIQPTTAILLPADPSPPYRHPAPITHHHFLTCHDFHSSHTSTPPNCTLLPNQPGPNTSIGNSVCAVPMCCATVLGAVLRWRAWHDKVVWRSKPCAGYVCTVRTERWSVER